MGLALRGCVGGPHSGILRSHSGASMPTYSHSRLSSFEKCKLQYRYRYVDRIRRDIQSIEAFLGNRVHEVLEKLYKDLQMERTPALEELTGLYQRSWEKLYTDKIRIVKTDYVSEQYRNLRELRTFPSQTRDWP